MLYILQLLLSTDFVFSSSLLILKHVPVLSVFLPPYNTTPSFTQHPSLATALSISSLYSQSSWEFPILPSLFPHFRLTVQSTLPPLFPEIAAFLGGNSSGFKGVFLGHQTWLTIHLSWKTHPLPPVRVIRLQVCPLPGHPFQSSLYIPLPLLSLLSSALPSPGFSNPFLASPLPYLLPQLS